MILFRVGGPGPAFIVESFALLAVATSFIGTVLGLSEFLLEQLGKAQGSQFRILLLDHIHVHRFIIEHFCRTCHQAVFLHVHDVNFMIGSMLMLLFRYDDEQAINSQARTTATLRMVEQ